MAAFYSNFTKIFSQGSIGTDDAHANFCTNDGLVHWRILAFPGLSEWNFTLVVN